MGAKKLSQLRAGLHEPAPESRERVAREASRLAEELRLTELRERMQRTQAEIAQVIGTSQSGVSRLERQRDVLVSTLRDYVAATGGRLRLVAEYPGGEVHIRVPVLDDEHPRRQEQRAFRVVWQNLRTRQLVHVGQLEFTDRRFVYSYTPDAELHPDFVPFPAFPDFRESYESDELFPFFADRLLSAARGGYDDHLAALGLTREEATPVELLARSGGASPHDTIQVVPEPVEHEDGNAVLPFLVSGVRHVDDASTVNKRIASLREGEELDLRDEPDNPHNDRAVRLEAKGQPVGWIPDYLLEQVWKNRGAGRRIHVTVERANGPETPWHIRLLCRLEIGPDATDVVANKWTVAPQVCGP